MRLRLHDHELMSDDIRKIIDHEVQILDRRLAKIDPDLVLLDATVQHQLRSDTLNAKLVLHVLDREVASHGKGETPGQALRDAFGNLTDQIDVFLSKLRSEAFIRDEQRRPSWRGQPGVPKE